MEPEKVQNQVPLNNENKVNSQPLTKEPAHINVSPKKRLVFVVILALCFLTLLAAGLAIRKYQSSPASSTSTPQLTQGSSGGCNHTGITLMNAIPSFVSLTTDAMGNIVDVNNPSCIIHLLGFNQGWFDSGDTGGPDAAGFASYHRLFQYNYIRVNINARWWVDNPQVPKYNADFRTVLTNYIHTAEQSGLYVALNIDGEFPDPPCPVGSSHCTKQSQGKEDYNNPSSPHYHDPTILNTYQPTAISAITDLANTFKNDPAILFDVWNEPAAGETQNIPEQLFFKDMQERVNAVTSVTANHIIIVYIRALNDIISDPSSYPDFAGKNIMYDVHLYSGKWVPSNAAQFVAFTHQHGHGLTVGEWGGKPGLPTPVTLIPFLAANNVNATYFGSGDLVDNSNNPTSVNNIGQAVASGYASIFQGNGISPQQLQTSPGMKKQKKHKNK